MIEELLDNIKDRIKKSCAARKCKTCTSHGKCIYEDLNKMIRNFEKKYSDDGK